jgi:hypothetical protein
MWELEVKVDELKHSDNDNEKIRSTTGTWENSGAQIKDQIYELWAEKERRYKWYDRKHIQ